MASSLTEFFAPDLMSRRILAWEKHYPWVDGDALAYFRQRVPPFVEIAAQGVLGGLRVVFVELNLAIVHACGSPDTTRSHFDAQDYMESGTPGVKSTRDGFLSRALEQKEILPVGESQPIAVDGAASDA